MTPARSVSVFAPAKVNLTLHITGQRDDGYHLLDSLVAFADVGDNIFIQTGNTLSLTTEGPETPDVPVDMNNLILKVAGIFDELRSASFLLTKNLPVSSGIGGGSADAAATFRGLLLFLDKTDGVSEITEPAMEPMAEKLLALGADIPMCLLSAYARVQGIGEQIRPIDFLPRLDAVLVNPRCPVSTPDVFKALKHSDNPAMPDGYTSFADANAFIEWLALQRNDLEDAAIGVEPAVADVKTALQSDTTCRLARMSGSGATCFGLYGSRGDAERAAQALQKVHPGWWVRATQLGSQTHLALPRVS